MKLNMGNLALMVIGILLMLPGVMLHYIEVWVGILLFILGVSFEIS